MGKSCYLLAAKTIFVLCITFCLNTPAMAWWNKGHQTVALIAYQNLSADAKHKVDALTQVLARDYPAIHEFSDIATWPDEIRQQNGIETFTHWHYIDTPFANDDASLNFAMDTDNILWAINSIKPIFKKNKAPPAEQARFLAFLVHLVGDAHQPLHAASRLSKAHPTGDKGGNLFFVKDSKNPSVNIPLHAIWDGDFNILSDDAPLDIKIFANSITTRYPEKFFGKQTNDLNADDWVQESNLLAKNTAYSIEENTVPSAAYQDMTNEVIQQRIALAGYRLAHLLNAFFS